MAKEFFDDFLAEIMSELNKPMSRINSDPVNKKINIFIDFLINDCRHYNLKNSSPVSNYSHTFMIQLHNSNMNSLYNKATKEEQNKMDNQGSRLIHKLIPMSYNIHDYYDGIVSSDIPLLVDFFNKDKYLFNELIKKIGRDC
jgi:hypothetical protein